MDRLSLSALGEQTACQILQKLGFTLIERNYRRKNCEIDLVMQDGQVIVFVEVKTTLFGSPVLPVDQITIDKIKRLKRAALTWSTEHQKELSPQRIDFVGLLVKDNGELVKTDYRPDICQ